MNFLSQELNVVVTAGASGIGKTMLLCDISAIVSRGGIFPGQKERCEAGKVVYLSGEDGLNHTIGPRLEAAGADMEQMLELPPLNNQGKLFDLSTDVDFITDHLLDIGGVSLFIIDPVTAFCGGRFDNDSVTSVRHLTTKLNDLADSTGVAIIALQHLTKSENLRLKNRILGSGAWVHGPRIVLGAVHTQENDRLFGWWAHGSYHASAGLELFQQGGRYARISGGSDDGVEGTFRVTLSKRLGREPHLSPDLSSAGPFDQFWCEVHGQDFRAARGPHLGEHPGPTPHLQHQSE